MGRARAICRDPPACGAVAPRRFWIPVLVIPARRRCNLQLHMRCTFPSRSPNLYTLLPLSISSTTLAYSLQGPIPLLIAWRPLAHLIFSPGTTLRDPDTVCFPRSRIFRIDFSPRTSNRLRALPFSPTPWSRSKSHTRSRSSTPHLPPATRLSLPVSRCLTFPRARIQTRDPRYMI